MRITLEQRRMQYRLIYESVFGTPRTFAKDISSILHVDRNTASRRMQEAFDNGYIVGPQIRKRSYSNLAEHVYLLRCKHPFKLFKELIKDSHVVYHAVMAGSPNLWIVSRKEIDVEGEIIVEGVRSDFHMSYAPNHSWKTAMEIMEKKVETFNPETYNPRGIIETHWSQSVEWDREFEMLYREFKLNLRKKQTPVRRKYLISGSKMQKWFERLPECCTVFTAYYPESLGAYNPYFFMFETDYEDFIVELYSELPTSSVFFKVSSWLFLCASLDRGMVSDISKIFKHNLLIENLLKRGIINSEQHTIFEYYDQKSL